MSMELFNTATNLDGYRRALEMVDAPLSHYGTPQSEWRPTPLVATRVPVYGPEDTMGTTRRPRRRGFRPSWIEHVLRPPVLLLASVSSILILLLALDALMRAG